MRETFTAWSRNYSDELVLFVRHGDRETVRDEATAIAGRTVNVLSSRVSPHGVAVLLDMQRFANHGSFDIVYSQNFAIKHDKSFVFVHDVLFMTNPEWFTWKERLYFSLMPLTAHRARSVFTSSQSETARIRANVRANEVVGVGLGGRQRMLHAAPILPADAPRAGEYVLTVGRFNKRKNLERVALAAVLSDSISPDRPLVVVGDLIPQNDRRHPAIDRAQQLGVIRSLGFVSDGELRWLYENCDVFVMGSLGEGFGMPVAEAAILHKPSVVSDLSVFREIADGLYFVDPLSAESISDGIDLASDGKRASVIFEELNWGSVVSRVRLHISRWLR